MVLERFLKLFFPICCVGCGKDGDEVVCCTCRTTVTPRAMYVETADCWCFYLFSDGWVRKALHAVKYGGIPQAVQVLVEQMREENCLEKLLPKTSAVLWIAVPVSNKRRKERGYNQVELITRGLQHVYGGELYSNALRKRDQKSLVGSSRSERAKQVAGAFAPGKLRDTTNRFVVLVDDIVTTGATVAAARETLERFGVHVDLVLAISHED